MGLNTDEIYTAVNDRILAALESGTAPWQRPWAGEAAMPRNLQSGKPYRGINSLLLSFSEFTDPRWSTFNAAKKMGGRVRKGEKSTLVILWKRIKVKDASASDGEKVIAILRYFRVFNVEQIAWPEGAVKPWKPAENPDDWNPSEEAESILADFLASDNAPTLAYGGNSAFYRPATHAMTLPPPGSFRSAHGFYGTAFHESAHATGHKSMLDREPFGAFGTERYAREELTAEMAAAFVCATIGIDGGFDNTAAYIDHWRHAIKNDSKLIVHAAAKAQKAADRIMGIVYEYIEPEKQAKPVAVAA